MIKRYFIPTDVEDILVIPLGRRENRDKIIWDMDSKGISSVKSVYHLAYNLEVAKDVSSSTCENQQSMWRKVWKMKIFPRTRIGLWINILKNYLPSKPNLLRKWIDINLVCVFCRSKLETPVHTLWR